MSRTHIGPMTTVFGVIWLLSVPVSTPAPLTAYIKLPDIDGECTDEGHEGWIELKGYSWGVELERDAATGLPTGKRRRRPFSATKELDKASPKLLEALTSGSLRDSATVDLQRDGDSEPYLRITLTEVLVSSVGASEACSTAAGEPLEEFTLDFGGILTTHVPSGINSDGTTALAQSEFDLRGEPRTTAYGIPDLGVIDGYVYTIDGRRVNQVTVRGPLSVADFGLSRGAYVLQLRVATETGASEVLLLPVVVE